MRIIFFGTPDFAVESLRLIHESKFDVVAVVTAPDKPAGRGRKLQESEVKQFAVEQKLPVLQPEKLKDPDFVSALKNFNADLFVIVAFRMLPEVVWQMPPLGSINLHASYLPNYRGAAPINHAIINGEKETGITTFFLKHDIDTGNIILQEKMPIFPNENAGSLYNRLKEEGAKLLVKTLKLISEGKAEPKPQQLNENKTELKHAPKIFKEHCQINWSWKGERIVNLVRGLAPFPGAYSYLLTDEADILIKFFDVKFEELEANEEPSFAGKVITNGKNEFKIACENGYIWLNELQMQGKKRMMLEDWLRGYKLQETPQFFFKKD